jgi:hypothetical protein
MVHYVTRVKYFSIRGAIIYLPYNCTSYDVQCAVQVILTLTIGWVMWYDSIVENKNMCASHWQVYPACYHFSNSNIAVVGKDIRSCTTYITGHANRVLSQPSTFSDPYLYRTAMLRAFCLLVALLHGQRQVLGTFGTSPPLPRPLHFPHIFAHRWQQLRL